MTPSPICLLLAALGGQGGGVLTDWLVESARLEGFPAQATSIPGVAQRTGATTYYFELFPLRNPPADPVFCLFPSVGNVDLVAALEPTEAGRALENGYVTANTTVITSTQRQYSTAEKSVAGDGTIDTAPILAALERVARKMIAIHPSAAPGAPLNALVFGAIIAAGVLPFDETTARRAIREKGLAVPANLAAFDLGTQLARGTAPDHPRPPTVHYHPAPDALQPAVERLPPPTRRLIGHALARLADYQNIGYAQLFLQRIQPVILAEEQTYADAHAFRLSIQTARRLAAWMSREDVFRVAQLKTRAERFARIRRELRAQPGDPVRVVDYLSPGREELMSMLPAPLARLFWRNNNHTSPSPSLHLAWPTSNPFGFAALKLLAALKPLRPHTLAYAREQKAIENWLQAVRLAIPVDYQIALLAAEASVWARGYGEVRARGLRRLHSLFANWAERLQHDPAAVTQALQNAIHQARHDPDAGCRSSTIINKNLRSWEL